VDNTNENKRIGYILSRIGWWSISIILITFWAFQLNIPQHFYWQKKPGSLFEKQDYTTSVYVRVYPSAKSNKNYWLPGVISREDSCDPNSDISVDGPCTRLYILYAVKWPNGGVVNTDECLIDFNLQTIEGCVIGSRTYYVQLTNKLYIKKS